MDYEKAYNKALERAKKWYNAPNADKIPTYANRIIVEIFPELKESEDEKMWKLIKKYAHYNVSDIALDADHISRKELETWLEKQSEKKVPSVDFKAKDCYVSKVDGKIHDITYNPTDKLEPKFKFGDWIVNNNSKDVFLIKSINSGYCTLESIKGNIISPCLPPCESESHIWTIQDAKDGDVLAGSKNDVILMFRGIGNTEWDDVIDYHCYYDCYRKDFIVQEDVKYWGNIENNQLKPATKEQRDLLFSKMKEAGYQWNPDKKELKKIEDEIEIPFDANDSELTEVTYYIPKGFHAEIDDDKVVIKIGENKPIMNVPTREVILAIWDLGNEWKELTNGSISTKYGTQLDYIQKHWHESEYYLREKQNQQKSKKETKTTAYGFFGKYGAVEYVYILDYCSGRVIVAKHNIDESISELFDQLGLKENQCHYMVSSNILSIEYINF